MTEDLIDRLAQDANPVSRTAVPVRLAGAVIAGLAAATVLLLAWLGLRSDFPVAFADPVFWIKFAYPLGLAGCGFWAAERATRPAASARPAILAALALIALSFVLGVLQLSTSAPADMRGLILGGTALICPFLIVALSLPILAAGLVASRRLAPTNLSLAGSALGLLAGAAGAWVYSFHCGENGLPFLALWYTLGIVLTAGIGSLIGRWALRW